MRAGKAKKVKRFRGQDMYAVYKRAFTNSAQATTDLGGPRMTLSWHELSEDGRKAWTSVARAANGTLKS